MEMMCPICGELYEAKTRNKRYCSGRCRTAAHRMHAETFRQFEAAFEVPPSPVLTVDCMNALRRANITANDFYFLSRTAPYQLRAKFDRIANAISDALLQEGFR